MRATLAVFLPIPAALLVATASAQPASPAPDAPEASPPSQPTTELEQPGAPLLITPPPSMASSPRVVPAALPSDPAASPFVSLDRSDGVSRLGVDLIHLNNAQGGGLLFGGALFGRYVDPRSGVGGYASLPFSLGSGLQGGETVFELSGIELGGIYAHRFSPGAAIVAHAGFATAPLADDVDYLPYAGFSNPSDLLNAFSGTKLKAGISPLLRSGKLVARLDLGTAYVRERDVGPLITFGAGAGYGADRLSVMVELSGLMRVTDNDRLANAWVTGRLDLGRVRPYLGLGTPLTEVRELFPLLITVGADVAL